MYKQIRLISVKLSKSNSMRNQGGEKGGADKICSEKTQPRNILAEFEPGASLNKSTRLLGNGTVLDTRKEKIQTSLSRSVLEPVTLRVFITYFKQAYNYLVHMKKTQK